MGSFFAVLALNRGVSLISLCRYTVGSLCKCIVKLQDQDRVPPSLCKLWSNCKTRRCWSNMNHNPAQASAPFLCFLWSWSNNVRHFCCRPPGLQHDPSLQQGNASFYSIYMYFMLICVHFRGNITFNLASLVQIFDTKQHSNKFNSIFCWIDTFYLHLCSILHLFTVILWLCTSFCGFWAGMGT